MTSASARPGRTTAPSGIRATVASKAAIAGAAVVIPAARVKPGGGWPDQRVGGRPQQTVAALGQVDKLASLQFVGPKVDDRAQAVERHLPMSGQVGIIGGNALQP